MNMVELDASPSQPPDEPGSAVASFISAERTQKFDLLSHLIVNLAKPLVLVGPDGIGKTTFFKAVEDAFPDVRPSGRPLAVQVRSRQTAQEQPLDACSVCSLTSSCQLSLENILEELLLATGFTKSASSVGEIERILIDYLHQFAKHNRRLILLLDDAGTLAPGLIDALCQFAQLYPALRLVLAMRPDDLHVKATTDLRLEECHFIDIPPLTENQCGEYLRFLATKSSRLIALDAITEDFVRDVYRKTHGVPGNINALLPVQPKETVRWTKSMGLPVYLGLAIAITVAVAITLWQESRPPKPGKAATPESGAAKPEDILAPVASPGKETEQGSTLSASQNRADAQSGIPFDSGSTSMQNKAAPVDPLGARPPPVGADAELNKDAQVAQKPEKQIPVISEEGTQAVKAVDGSRAAHAHSVNSEQQSSSLPEGLPEEAVVSNLGENAMAGVKGEEWLLSQNPADYSLQLIGVDRFDALAAFVERYPQLKELAYYRTRRKGGDWFALISGIFPSFKSVQKAAEQLPPSIADPWIRRLGAIQEDIRKYQKE